MEQHELFAECLELVLDARNYLHWHVPVASDPGQTDRIRSTLLSLRPDVALVSADLGRACDGPAVVTAASRTGVAVAVLATSLDEQVWGQYLAAGAQVVVPKSAPLASMVSVVGKLARGERVLDLAERERLIEVSRRGRAELRAARARLDRLSAQEAEVLRRLMAGLTVREIASDRVVSEGTVRTQVKSVLAKLEVNSQLSAVALAHAADWRAGPARCRLPADIAPPRPRQPDARPPPPSPAAASARGR